MSEIARAGGFLVRWLTEAFPELLVRRSYLTAKDATSARLASDPAELLVVFETTDFELVSRGNMSQTIIFALILRQTLTANASIAEIDALVEKIEELDRRLTATVRVDGDDGRKRVFVKAQHSDAYPCYDLDRLAENKFEGAIQLAVQVTVPWDATSDAS